MRAIPPRVEDDAPLTLRLLGPPLLRGGGADIRLPSQKALALLCFLALHPGAPQSRAALATLLWEDSPERDGRNSLSTALSHLRQALPHLPIKPEPESLTWQVSADIWVDTDAVAAALDAQAAPAAQLETAAGLWRGPLLEGLAIRAGEGFEEWLRQERETWTRRYLTLLGRLIGTLEAEGEWARGIAHAERALALDPLRERFHRALMLLHARSGDRAAALRQYRLCRQILRDELGAEPDARTAALAEAITAGKVERTAPATAARAAPEPLAPPVSAPSGPLVGREEEQRALRSHLNDALLGHRRLVILEGEAGIGKSRLLEELLWRLHGGDWSGSAWSALLGHSYEAERGLAYRPFVEALERALPRLDARALGIPEVWLAEVARLVPDLAERLADRPAAPRADPNQDQRRLFEGVARLLDALPGPLLLALEDLHWADEGSQALLGFLLRYASGRPLLVVATARPEEHDESLTRLLRSLEREGRLARLRLWRLTSQDTVLLVQAMLSRDMQPLGERVYRETEGNPLFAIETVRALLEGGAVTAAGAPDAQRLVIPASVQAVIESRLARLEPGARDFLNAVAVFRRAVEFELAREVSGQAEEVALDALEALLRANLLREALEQGVPGRPGGAESAETRYALSHGMIQQRVNEGMSAARRSVLHRRALAALKRGGGGLAEPLAYHALRGQLWDEALVLSVTAAEEATRLPSYSAGALLYEQALTCLAHLPGGEDTRLREIDLRLRLAEVAFYVRPGRLAEWLAPAERLAAAIGDRDRLAAVWSAQARALYIGGSYGKAVPMLRRLVDLARAANDPLWLANSENFLGRALVICGEHRQGVDLLRGALPTYTRAATPQDLAATTGLIATGLAWLGQFEAALVTARSSLSRGPSDDPTPDAVAHFFLALVHHTRGDWQPLLEHASRAYELAREADNTVYQYLSTVYLGHAHAFLRGLEEGIETQERAIVLADRARTRAILGRAHAWAADLYRRAGRLDEARRHAGHGRAISDEEQAWVESGLCIRMQGEIALDVGDLRAAERLLGEARVILAPLEAAPELARLDVAASRLARARGDLAGAERLLDGARAAFTRMGMRSDLGELPAQQPA